MSYIEDDLSLLQFASSNGSEEGPQSNNPNEGNPQGNNSDNNPQGNNSNAGNPQENNPDNNPQGNSPTPSENGFSSEGDGYHTDSNRSYFEEGADAMADYPVGGIPDNHLRRYAEDTARMANRPGLAGIQRDEDESSREFWRGRHQELTEEIRRRKDQGTMPDSPDPNYDASSSDSSSNSDGEWGNLKLPPILPENLKGRGESGGPSGAGPSGSVPSGAGPSASAPSANTDSGSAVENAAPSANTDNGSSGQGVEPRPALSWLETILGTRGTSSSVTDQNISAQDPKTNTANSRLEQEGESSASTSKIKLEEQATADTSPKRKLEEEGESSTQPSKKFKQDSSDITGDTEPFDIGGGDD